MVTFQPEPTEDIGVTDNSTAPASSAQESDDGARRSDHPEAEQPAHYLYLLVSAATTGDLAGLFKLGITNHLPTRYRHHTCIWDEFDLGRSVLLRVGSRRQVQRLEGILKEKFQKWRRYPGSHRPGFTEFFSMECFAAACTTLEDVGVRTLGGRLVRRISPAECELAMWDNGRPPLTREMRARRDAAERQAFQKLRTQYEAVMALVHELALAHEQDLLWVDLRLWHQSREVGSGAFSGAWGLIDLYFERIGPAPSAVEIESGQRSAAQIRREEDFAPIAALVASMDPDVWGSIGPGHRRACHLRELNNVHSKYLPHRSCVGKPLLRLESFFSNPFYPLFDQFEALAQRIQTRSWTQLDLC